MVMMRRNAGKMRSHNLNSPIDHFPPQVWKFNGDDKELVAEERDDRFVWPTRDIEIGLILGDSFKN